VLAGRVPLGKAVQRAPRQPRLSVLTTGGTASAGGLLQSQALRDALGALRRQAEYVIVEAPSTSMSADAQSVASLADAAIIAIELRRTRYADVTDAAEQLRRIGTPLLGAVVLPKLVRNRDEPPPAPAPADEPDAADQADLLEELARLDDASPADTVVLTRVKGKRSDVDTAVLALTGIDMNGIAGRNGASTAEPGRNRAASGEPERTGTGASEPAEADAVEARPRTVEPAPKQSPKRVIEKRRVTADREPDVKR